MTVERIDAREHHDPEDRQREQVEQRLRDHRAEHDRQRLARAAEAPRDDQRTRGLSQTRRQRGGHQHSDERALHRVPAFRLAPGRCGREDLIPGDRAGEHRDAHQPQAGDEQSRTRGEQAFGNAADADVHEREQREHEAAERGSHQRATAQRAQRALARELPDLDRSPDPFVEPSPQSRQRHAARRAEPRDSAGAERGCAARDRRAPGRGAPRGGRRASPAGRRPEPARSSRAPRRRHAARRSARRALRASAAIRARAAGSSASERSASASASASPGGVSTPVDPVAHDVAVAGDVGGDHRRARQRAPR